MNNLNKVNFFQMNSIEPMKLNGSISMNSDDNKIKSFKDTIGDMVREMNEVTNKPQVLASEAIQGRADIHDVMAAVAQSELTVQLATTVTGKILQTYEKIMQIQI